MYLQHLGFAALATTSAGFGFSKGFADDALPRDAVLAHVAEIARAVDVPVNVDYQSGYADSLGGLTDSVNWVIAAGASGFSIEDATNDPTQPLFELEEAVERMMAVRAAIDASGTDTVLTGRAECFLVGHPDPLNEAIRRLQAYSDAGADVLFAPGLRTREDIRTLVDALRPKPVNVLIGWNSDLSVSDLADLGVRRISVGSGLARAAWTGFANAAKQLADGSFDGMANLVPFGEINGFFKSAAKKG